MTEDRYRLAPLREVRERSEVTRRGNLVRAIGDAQVTEDAVTVAAARVERAGLVLHAAEVSGATATELVAAERYRSRLRAELAATRDEALRAQLAHAARGGEVELARAQLARARADREVIERHFTAWRDAQRKRRDNRD